MSRIYRVGDLTLDAGRQELRRGAESVHLGPLTYRFLLALIEAAPNVVGHDALAAAVWDGRPVSNETISQRVKLLREAIGDNPHEPRYIELLRGRGYRLIPPVAVETREAAREPRGGRLAGIAAVIALAAAGLIWLTSGTDPVPPPGLSVAVLPFDDLSPRQDQEYLADGIAAEILNVLSRSTPLKVTAQTSSFSFKGQNADVAKIAQALHVSHVLEGSVRTSGTRIRINAQLVSAADGTNVWSDTYDRELRDVLGLQKEIAGSVAAALETSLIGEDSRVGAAPEQVDPEAFTAYLRGQQRYQQGTSEGSVDEAVRYLKESIEIDPSFLPAYSGLGMIYSLQIVGLNATVAETLPKLRELAEQARKYAPGESAFLLALDAQVARYEGNFELAEQQLERAAELAPFDAWIASQNAMFKLDQGFPNEALQVYQRLAERDPLNPGLYSRIWACHMDRGDARAAITAAVRMEEVRPVATNQTARLALRTPKRAGLGLRAIARALLLGDIAGSIREDETQDTEDWYPYPLLYYTLGDRAKGDAALERWQELLAPNALDTISYILAYRHLLTGKIAAARQQAREAFTTREDYSASYDDYIGARLTFDALITEGNARRAVELIESMAPVYATYRSRPDMHPLEFSPAPYSVKGAFSSYPAYYFPDYIRALRAAGDPAGADNMLQHLEAILRWRMERGQFVEGRHFAEARMLRGDVDGALDALEQAERDRTLYIAWHVFLLHNEIFADIRHHPRFEGLVSRVREEMDRQRAKLDGT